MNIVWICPLIIYMNSSTCYTWESTPEYLNNPIIILKLSWAVSAWSAQFLCSHHHLSDEVYTIWIATPFLWMNYHNFILTSSKTCCKLIKWIPCRCFCAPIASGRFGSIFLLNTRGVIAVSLSKFLVVSRHPHFNFMQGSQEHTLFLWSNCDLYIILPFPR